MFVLLPFYFFLVPPVSSETDFLDIFLSAKCRFFISSGTGIDAVPMVFRRPVLYVNFLPMERMHTWGPDDILVPKKLWLRKEQRFMTFREIIESGAGKFLHGEFYEEHGIDGVENSSDEIKNAAVEMDDRLAGTWQTSEKDKELQQKFWSLFQKGDLHGDIVAKVSTHFLRDHLDLLEVSEGYKS